MLQYRRHRREPDHDRHHLQRAQESQGQGEARRPSERTRHLVDPGDCGARALTLSLAWALSEDLGLDLELTLRQGPRPVPAPGPWFGPRFGPGPVWTSRNPQFHQRKLDLGSPRFCHP